MHSFNALCLLYSLTKRQHLIRARLETSITSLKNKSVPPLKTGQNLEKQFGHELIHASNYTKPEISV